MSYEIELGPKAEKVMNKLPKETALRLTRKLQAIKENPFHFLEHIEINNFYKLRIGDYRALIEVDFENKKMIVRMLDKRSRIYKK